MTGIWNLFTLMSLPVLAVLVMATANRPDATMITGAAVGLVLLAAMAGGLGLLLRSEACALRASRVLQCGLAIACHLAGGAGHEVSAQVTAAVLLYRAVTYLPSIPRRPCLPHLAVCTRAHQRQSTQAAGQARITMTARAGAMRSAQWPTGREYPAV